MVPAIQEAEAEESLNREVEVAVSRDRTTAWHLEIEQDCGSKKKKEFCCVITRKEIYFWEWLIVVMEEYLTL